VEVGLKKTWLVVEIFFRCASNLAKQFCKRTYERLVPRYDDDLRDLSLRMGVHVEESEYQG
jgi:hypothetical protein